MLKASDTLFVIFHWQIGRNSVTVYIYVVGVSFSKKDDIVILLDVIRFTAFYFHKEKHVIIFMLQGGNREHSRWPSLCGASLCCMPFSLPFVDSYWVRVIVRQHGRLSTLYRTVKSQAVMIYPEFFILQIDAHLHDQRSQRWFNSVQFVDYPYNFYKHFIWQCTDFLDCSVL